METLYCYLIHLTFILSPSPIISFFFLNALKCRRVGAMYPTMDFYQAPFLF